MRSRTKRALAIVADRALGVAAPLLVAGRREARPLPANPRILVVRCDHIGDAAMAATVLGPLREQTGASRLDVLAGPWAADLFADHPAVDSVLSYATPWWLHARGARPSVQRAAWRELPDVIARIRRERYDVGIDLRGDLRHILYFLTLGGCAERVGTDRTGGRALLTRATPFDPRLHEIDKNAAIVGLLGATVDRAPLPVSPIEPALAAEIRAACGPDGYVALANRGNQPSHRWPLAHAQTLARRIGAELGLGVVYVGGPDDRAAGDAVCAAAAPHAVNLAGRTTLNGSRSILASARALVTVDTGPMHLAGLTSTPVVALFGAGDAVQFGPWSPARRIAGPRARCECHLAPICRRTTDGSGACMETIVPDDVFALLVDVLAAERDAATRATAPFSASDGGVRRHAIGGVPPVTTQRLAHAARQDPSRRG